MSVFLMVTAMWSRSRAAWNTIANASLAKTGRYSMWPSTIKGKLYWGDYENVFPGVLR